MKNYEKYKMIENDGPYLASLVTPKEVRIESIAHLNEMRERSCHTGEMAHAKLCGANLGKF